MFDSPSCEIQRMTAVGGATGVGCKLLLPVVHSLCSFDDCAIDGIDLIDDVVVVVDDASREYQTLRRQTMACEMSEEY